MYNFVYCQIFLATATTSLWLLEPVPTVTEGEAEVQGAFQS